MRRRRPDRRGQYERESFKDLVGRVAANVRRLRLRNGLTQEAAAELCDMAVPMLQRIEAGSTNLTFTTLARLCDGFEVDARDLLRPMPKTAPRAVGRPRSSAKSATGR